MHTKFLAGWMILITAATAISAEWPQFRGPAGQGNSGARGLPLTWSEAKNVKWKTAIHGRAWSSPVIQGNQIWLTTATEDGQDLFVLCLDRETGSMTRNLKIFHVEQPQFAHRFNTYASPSPVIEPGRVYVTFGSPGTACLDTETGKVLWERRDFVCNHYRGAGSSPLLHEDLLILNFDGSDHQYVVALDKHTGKTVWRTNRSVDFNDAGADGLPHREGDLRKGFSTPRVMAFEGRSILLSQGSKAAYAYDPRTGVELWRVEEHKNHSSSVTPVIGHDLAFLCTGLPRGELWAVRPDGQGVVTDTHVAWSVKRNVPTRPSPVLVDDLLFMIDDGGIASCLEAKTGEEVWRERIGGNYSASPLHADKRIYFFNEEGKATVIAAGREFKVLAENSLDHGFMASAAVAGRALYLRTTERLYRIEE